MCHIRKGGKERRHHQVMEVEPTERWLNICLGWMFALPLVVEHTIQTPTPTPTPTPIQTPLHPRIIAFPDAT